MTTTEAPKTRREITARLNEIAPYPDQDTPDHARAVAKYLAVSAQRRWKYNLDLVDTHRMDSIEYRLSVQAMLGEFAALHLLMALMNTAPEQAEELAVQIRDAWDDGSEVGSWLWGHELVLGIDADEVSRLEEAWRAAPESAAATTGEQA
jgi:hypothetical protein